MSIIGSLECEGAVQKHFSMYREAQARRAATKRICVEVDEAHCKVVENREVPPRWGVGAVDYDGKGCLVIFSGRDSQQRAREYLKWMRSHDG